MPVKPRFRIVPIEWPYSKWLLQEHVPALIFGKGRWVDVERYHTIDEAKTAAEHMSSDPIYLTPPAHPQGSRET